MEKVLTAEESKRRKKKIGRIKKLFSYILLSAIGFSMVLPFLWMLSTSLKEPGDVFTYPPKWIPTKDYIKLENHKLEVNVLKKEEEIWEVEVVGENSPYKGLKKVLPKKEVFTRIAPVWENYPNAWNAIKIDTRLFGIIPITQGFLMFYLNSIFVAVCVTLGQVFTSSLAAYAFARLKFPGRDKLFIAYLATMMIPGAVTMIPVFILMKQIAWVDTYRALIIPAMFTAYGTFLLRQFFMTIPTDLEDAAKIDGCSLFGIYWRIILPLSKPALATLTIFVFIGSWNNFMWPLIMINSMEKKTLPIGLASFHGLYSTDWTLLMAASVMVVIPVIIVFIFGQRYFVEGIRLGAIKG